MLPALQRLGAQRAEASAFEVNFLDLLRQAAALNASDLHIDPLEAGMRVRVRIDGTLRVLQWVHDPGLARRFFHEAKRLCGFDMGKLGVPQDQRFRAEVVPYDLRASLLPALYGEKIVLRLLQRGKEFSLDRYLMPEAGKAALRRALSKWQGLILITGPTGSGKTTLLYSALGDLDADALSLHTLEDPVEYDLPGVIQSGLVAGTMGCGAALRALMRQDPDVIMVGEIRDRETARLALHAAGTGHLVLSTIHANSAMDSVARLVDLGLNEDQIYSSLLFASAQRLVPRNCPVCREPDHEGTRLVRELWRLELDTYSALGCSSCDGSGIAGRVLLFEYLTTTPGARGGRVPIVADTLREQAIQSLARGEIRAQDACAFD